MVTTSTSIVILIILVTFRDMVWKNNIVTPFIPYYGWGKVIYQIKRSPHVNNSHDTQHIVSVTGKNCKRFCCGEKVPNENNLCWEERTWHYGKTPACVEYMMYKINTYGMFHCSLWQRNADSRPGSRPFRLAESSWFAGILVAFHSSIPHHHHHMLYVQTRLDVNLKAATFGRS